MTSQAAPAALRATGLRKSFGTQVVLDGIDLEIATGTVFALLGPNGAGKTTIVQILSTLLTPDGGTATVAGFDLAAQPQRVRSAIGVTGQFSAVDNLLTGAENLQLLADLHHLGRRTGRRRAAELLEQFELADAAGKLVAAYSGGMRRRLDLAMTLIGDPKIIFLDEPTSGLDPRSRRTMWQIIRELAAAGTTILLTTQYLDEADELAGQIAVLDRGRLVAQGSPDELKRLIPGSHARLEFRAESDLAAAAALLDAAWREEDTLSLNVPADDTPQALLALLQQLDQHAIAVARVSVHTPDLDDVFFALTSTPERTG